MELPDGESWEFETDGTGRGIEESILLSDTRGNRPTEQIVIYGRVQQTSTVTWHLHRTALGGRRQAPDRRRARTKTNWRGSAATSPVLPAPGFVLPACRPPFVNPDDLMAIKPASSPLPDRVPLRRALISVFDKTGAGRSRQGAGRPRRRD